jgi:ketosteroid isomerase-like protein
MPKRILTLLVCILALSLSSFAAPKKSVKKAPPNGPAPDKAYMQKIWDGWSTLNTANTEQYYARGSHTFFDIAPLKYSSWEEYEKGVTAILKNYKSAKFTVNDDAELHHHGDLSWGTSTVKEDAVLSKGKHEMGTWRWTVVFENQGGKWLIVHEHISAPAQ